MALNITQETETKNINKGAEIKINETLVGTMNFDVTNKQYNQVSFNLYISNKELFVENEEACKADIQSFIDTFVTETVNVMKKEGTK